MSTTPDYAPQPNYGGQPPQARPTNVLAIIALVAGIIAFFTGLVPILGLLLGIVAVVLGFLGLRKAKALFGSGKGLAITGMILGAIALITSLVTSVIAGAALNSASDAVESAAPAPIESSAAPSDPAAGEDAAPAPAETSEAAPAPAPAGQFTGQQPGDTVVQAGEGIEADGLQITAGPLAPVSDALGSYLCTDVTLVNASDEQKDYNSFEWSLQDANGGSKTATITAADDALNSGSVAAGGNAAGKVCFDAVGAGQAVVIWEPLFSFDGARAAWLNTVA